MTAIILTVTGWFLVVVALTIAVGEAK